MKLLTLSKAVVPFVRIRYFSNRNILKTHGEIQMVQDIRYFSNRNILKTLGEKRMVQDIRFFSNRNILKTLGEKGMVQDVFPGESETEIANLLTSAARCLYAGFDPTADSLHVGNLLVLMGLIHAQRAGHSVVALIGGATGRIGDPSGKNVERPEISQEVLDNNLNGIKRDIVNIFDNHEKYFWTAGKNMDTLPPLQIVNNEVFYKDMNIIEFLSTIGRHFRLGRMLSRQSVKSRLESDQGISLTEFAYQTFQAYDWLQLYRERECLVQLGGSDQMGNLAAGQELISRVAHKQVYGVTMPLVVSEAGEKLGKTAGAPVWLNPLKTSPFSFYQYFIRLPDSQMRQMLTFFTFLHAKEIEKLMEKHKKAPEGRVAQQKLASCLTLLVHGQDGLDMARKTTDILYANDLTKLATLSLEETRTVFEGPQMYGATRVAKQFPIFKCGHSKPIPASECVLSLLSSDNPQHFLLASQDQQLRVKARRVPGTPVLYLHGNTPTLEKPSGFSEKSAEKAEDSRLNVSQYHGKVLKELKKQVFGENEVVKKKKRRGPKGPNPLSCKKKKKNADDDLRGVKDSMESEGKKRKRKRNRNKKLALANESS